MSANLWLLTSSFVTVYDIATSVLTYSVPSANTSQSQEDAVEAAKQGSKSALLQSSQMFRTIG